MTRMDKTRRALEAARAFWRKRDEATRLVDQLGTLHAEAARQCGELRRELRERVADIEATAIVRRYLESCEHSLEWTRRTNALHAGAPLLWCSRCGALGWPEGWTLPALQTVSPWEAPQ